MDYNIAEDAIKDAIANRRLAKQPYDAGLEKALEIILTPITEYPDVQKIIIQIMKLQAELKEIRLAATKWPRCCDLWQDGLGGMHCRECEQKTFAMLRSIQEILKVDKSCNPVTEEPKLCICCEEITEENAHLHRNCGK